MEKQKIDKAIPDLRKRKGGKEEEINQPSADKFLICPHCGVEIKHVEWRYFGNPKAVVLIACGNCLKVVGASESR